jgi:hypothetical protein
MIGGAKLHGTGGKVLRIESDERGGRVWRRIFETGSLIVSELEKLVFRSNGPSRREGILHASASGPASEDAGPALVALQSGSIAIEKFHYSAHSTRLSISLEGC